MSNETIDLAEQHLRLSGLTLADAKRFGVKVLTAPQTKKLFPRFARPSLQFQYYDLDGAVRNDRCRIRWLGPEPPGQFGSVNEKPHRYLQLKDSVVAAYFPKTVDWVKIWKDPEQVILITEGEKKALCAVKHGFTCVGLGGVWNWRSAKCGWSLLPELRDLNWYQHPVAIIFDSDGVENSGVQTAAIKFAEALSAKGALVKIIFLPALTKGLEAQADEKTESGKKLKTGLDDFLISDEGGREALIELIDAAEEGELTRRCIEFNKQFTVIISPDAIYDNDATVDKLLSPHAFRYTSYVIIVLRRS